LDKINDDVVQALVATPSSALLPSLRKLQWLDGRDSFLPLLRTLLVPTITSMKLISDRWEESWDTSFAKSALLASLGTHCTSIRELDCVYGTGREHNSDVVSEAVCDCRELLRLKTGVLNTRALAHLASLRSLKSLHFSLPYDDDDDSDVPPNSIPTFTFKLDELWITAPTHDRFARGFRSIRFLSCRSVVLYLDWDNADERYCPRAHISDFIVSFSECFTPALRQLRVEIPPWDDEYDPIFNDHSFAFGFDVIAPLLPFNRLTELDLDWICTSDVDDEALKNMAQSWPRLKKFSFGTGERWLIPPSVTFTGLVYLVQHCRHLYSIRMRFAACSIDTDSKPFSSTIPNEKLTTLFVGFSPIVDPMDVACQLYALLPNLTEVTRYDWDEFEDTPASYVEWKRVDEYLQVLAKGIQLREKIGGLLEECSLPSLP
jgi:hypothetical protein